MNVALDGCLLCKVRWLVGRIKTANPMTQKVERGPVIVLKEPGAR
jgi:hypothetical protein